MWPLYAAYVSFAISRVKILEFICWSRVRRLKQKNVLARSGITAVYHKRQGFFAVKCVEGIFHLIVLHIKQNLIAFRQPNGWMDDGLKKCALDQVRGWCNRTHLLSQIPICVCNPWCKQQHSWTWIFIFKSEWKTKRKKRTFFVFDASLQNAIKMITSFVHVRCSSRAARRNFMAVLMIQMENYYVLLLLRAQSPISNLFLHIFYVWEVRERERVRRQVSTPNGSQSRRWCEECTHMNEVFGCLKWQALKLVNAKVFSRPM